MNEQTELLREIRDLLLAMAEPALAKRDERLREALRGIVGKSKPRIKVVPLMDGSKSQVLLKKEADVDPGEMSRLLKALREAGLIDKDAAQNPKLVISIPPNFFEQKKG